MGMRLFGSMLVVLLAAVVMSVVGCRGKTAAPGTPEPAQGDTVYADVAKAKTEDLQKRWIELTLTSSKEQPNVDEASLIAQELTKRGPENTDVFLEALEDASSSPFAKSLVVVSLPKPQSPAQLEHLLKLADKSHDANTRWCAAIILGGSQDPRALEALKGMTGDENFQIRYHAYRGLALTSPENMAKYIALWDDPSMTDALRYDIIMRATEAEAQSGVPVFEKALRLSSLSEDARMLCAQMLGKAAQASSLPLLKECAETDPSEGVRQAAKAALEAMGAQASESQPETPAQAPAAAVKAEPSAPPAADAAPKNSETSGAASVPQEKVTKPSASEKPKGAKAPRKHKESK